MPADRLPLPLVSYPSPDPERPYVYPGTQTLINHFGITDLVTLQRVVNVVAGLRGERLDADPVAGDHDLAHLCAIHRHLFQDVFAWAGQPRTVNTEKHGQEFALAVEIPARFADLHARLRAENHLRGLEPEAFADRLAEYWYEAYSVHVFRDGNSRSMRHFFSGLASAAGHSLDFAALADGGLLAACRERFFKANGNALRDCMRRIARHP